MTAHAAEAHRARAHQILDAWHQGASLVEEIARLLQENDELRRQLGLEPAEREGLGVPRETLMRTILSVQGKRKEDSRQLAEAQAREVELTVFVGVAVRSWLADKTAHARCDPASCRDRARHQAIDAVLGGGGVSTLAAALRVLMERARDAVSAFPIEHHHVEALRVVFMHPALAAFKDTSASDVTRPTA